MIIESIKFGFRVIGNSKVFLFSQILGMPLFFLLFFSSIHMSFVEIFSIPIFFSIVIYILYYPFFFAGLILTSYSILKERKKRDIGFLEIIRNATKYYGRVLFILLIKALITFFLLLPSMVLALTLSVDHIFFWMITFLLNVFLAIYISLRLLIAPFCAVIDDKKIVESLKFSFEKTKGNLLKIIVIFFVIFILFLGLTLLNYLIFHLLRNSTLYLLISYILILSLNLFSTSSILFLYYKYLRKKRN